MTNVNLRLENITAGTRSKISCARATLSPHMVKLGLRVEMFSSRMSRAAAITTAAITNVAVNSF